MEDLKVMFTAGVSGSSRQRRLIVRRWKRMYGFIVKPWSQRGWIGTYNICLPKESIEKVS